MMMRRMPSIAVAVAALCLSSLAYAGEFVAVSLKRASEVLEAGDAEAKVRAMKLAGVTQPYAVVHDTKRDDLIIVGERVERMPALTLDDWAVAARCEFILECDPAVSIDQTQDTPKTGKQVVRFQGALENTQFGADMLAADIVLKQLGLGRVSGEIFGVSSFLELSAHAYEQNEPDASDFTRFWFVPRHEDSHAYARDGVVIVQKYKIDVRSQRYVDGAAAENADPAVERFSQSVRNNFGDLKATFPELARMEQLYHLTALAQGLGKLGIEQRDPAIRYWVKQHDIKHVKTRTTYPLQSNSVEVEHESGQKSKLSASGGIDMDVMVLNLEDGMPDTIKQYVLAARPEGAPLSWDVPLAARSWTLDHNGRAIESAIERHREQGNFGMSIQRRLQPFQNGQPMPMRPDPVTVPPTSQLQFAPPRRASHQMPTTRLRQVSSDIGGVMLEGAAQVQSDDGNAGLSIAAGNFSLVLGDRDSRVHPRVYRRFVTALWCVYLGDTDPGISIDPIAPGADRQLVRYIGHIRNTDLARVMREADYVMKKWAVGTDRPDVKGFNSPDEYSAQRGVAYLDSMSRFWFVPKDMRFRSTGNALIFDRGQMTVQTEFLMNNAQGLQADPANEDFARWFTKFYPEVAEQYPVYQALFEYSKHVSLANYLKNSDMPLFWFLLANRDLVLTEDSPGTVDTLRADSDALKGVRIEGGVQLVSKPEYILDREARSAIEKAHAQQLARRASTTTTDDTAQAPSPTLMKTVSVAMGDRAYTFVPQHSASSGVDRRGVRYQTDLSINEEGFVITKATLQEIKPELHRHFLWEGLRPYVKQMKDKQDNKAQRQVFEQKYEEAWSAAEHETARVLERLGPIMDKKYMDAAKFENDLAFVLEGDDLLTARKLIARRAHYRTQFDLVRFSAPFTNEQATEFGAGWRLLVPYRLTFSDETVAFRNVALPRQVTLVDQLHGKKETLTFSEDHPTGAVGYFPAGNSDSLTIGLYLMADLTFQLEDKLGCRFEFNGNGQMTAMVLTETHRMSFEHEPLVSFDVTPYELQPMREAGTVTVVDGQVAVPKRLRIVDAHERERSFVFNSDAATIEWLPDDAQAKDRFKRIAMMADGSFRLHDRFGHRIRFDRTGAFDSVIPSPDSHCVSQLGFGHQKVKFRYEINREGRLVVDEAWAYVDPENDVPSYVVDYRYDQSFRLAGREIETAAGEPVDWRQKY